MRSFIFAFLILATLLTAAPLPAHAFSLVPCGTAADQPPAPWKPGDPIPAGFPNAQCNLRHLFVAITRIINYLVSISALVAMFYIINAGFGMVFALGNPEYIQKNKQALQQAVVGFGFVVISFVFINLLVNGLLSNPGAERQWWNIDCLFSFNPTGCPLGIRGPQP